MNVNKRLKELRKRLGLTQFEIAERLGVSLKTYQRYEKDGYRVPEISLRQIEALFSVNPNWLREGKGEMFLPKREVKFLDVASADFVLIPVPVISNARAGRGLYPYISEPEEVKMAWIPKKKAEHKVFFFKVEGDSMKPRLQPGDLVLADMDSSVMNGDIAVIELSKNIYEEGEVLIKKFYKKRDVVILESYNPDFHPIIVKPDEIKAMAKVISIIPNGES